MFSGQFITKRLRVFLWSLASVTAVGGSFFAIAGVLSWFHGTAFFENENLYLSLICAVIAWLLTAIFLFGRETVLLPVNQPAAFLANAHRVLAEMGYDIAAQTENSLLTVRAFQCLFIARGVRIHWLDKQARIAGPKIWVDILRRRLRVQNFLSHSELSMGDTWVRSAGVLLKRVHIQMRVLPEEFDEVNRNVVQLLSRDAEVVCEISLLVNSDNGIRETTVEQLIRPWLQERGIVSEIHKDLIKMAEAPSGVILAGKHLSDLIRRKTVKS